MIARADPGFPVGRVPTLGGERQHKILPNFPKQNCMKLRKCWPWGARPLDPPLDSPATFPDPRVVRVLDLPLVRVIKND